MSRLRPIELKLINDLFGMDSGWVLDFSNKTFADFFQGEVEIDIYDDVYAFESGSKGKRLRRFLEIGQPKAIVRALSALWEYREIDRISKGQSETIANARKRLSDIVIRLGGEQLPQHDLQETGPSPQDAKEFTRVNHAELDRLARIFLDLYNMDDRPQGRGYKFEQLLTDLFCAWNMDARHGFKLIGEQIDGSFYHQGTTFLVEAKWHKDPLDASSLRSFQGKIDERIEGTKGLFIGYNGFTTEALQAFTARRIILADGMDIYDALQRRIPWPDIITAKMRHASEFRNPMKNVRDLFPV